MRKIKIVALVLVSIVLPVGAVEITKTKGASEDIFAKAHDYKNKGLTSLSFQEVIRDRDLTVIPTNGTAPERDDASDETKLGYPTQKVETVTWEYTFDTKDQVGNYRLAVLVDDEATLTIKLNGKTVKQQRVAGGALWNPVSFGEISYDIEPDKVYEVSVEYKNTANLTKDYEGFVDKDGISVYYYKKSNTLDLDIDSRNQNGFGAVPADDATDRIEALPAPEEPGKIVFQSFGFNSNGVPSYAAGYNVNLATTADDKSPTHQKFVPMRLTLGHDMDPAKAKVKFSYSDSHPIQDVQILTLNLGFFGKVYLYRLKKNGLRIWTKDANIQRKGTELAQGGHFIKPDTEIFWKDLLKACGGSSNARDVTLYVEYVWLPTTQNGLDPSKTQITANAKDGAIESEDVVNVTAGALEVIRLAPLLTNIETGVNVAGSDKPRLTDGQINPMVETNFRDRIAFRQVQIRIRGGQIFNGRTIEWSLNPTFTNNRIVNPGIRGSWNQGANGHNSRFEASTAFQGNGYNYQRRGARGQDKARTRISANGHTGVRVNLPPYGYNSADLVISSQGLFPETKILSMLVPARVVIDPGHGGGDVGNEVFFTLGDGTDFTSHESVMAFDLSQRLFNKLKASEDYKKGKLLVKMTRTANVALTLPQRRNDARDVGADLLISIHFNDDGNRGVGGTARRPLPQQRVRGSQGYIRNRGNVNANEDTHVATLLTNATIQAARPFDANQFQDADYRGEPQPYVHVPAQSWGVLVRPANFGVLSEHNMGQNNNYHPLRSMLLEVDFNDNWDADWLYNNGPNKERARSLFAEMLSPAVINSVRTDP